MEATITVRHIGSDMTFDYVGLTPERALVAAYEQATNSNWSTWTYKAPSEYPIELGRYHYFLGDFAVRRAA